MVARPRNQHNRTYGKDTRYSAFICACQGACFAGPRGPTYLGRACWTRRYGLRSLQIMSVRTRTGTQITTMEAALSCSVFAGGVGQADAHSEAALVRHQEERRWLAGAGIGIGTSASPDQPREGGAKQSGIPRHAR